MATVDSYQAACFLAQASPRSWTRGLRRYEILDGPTVESCHLRFSARVTECGIPILHSNPHYVGNPPVYYPDPTAAFRRIVEEVI